MTDFTQKSDVVTALLALYHDAESRIEKCDELISNAERDIAKAEDIKNRSIESRNEIEVLLSKTGFDVEEHKAKVEAEHAKGVEAFRAAHEGSPEGVEGDLSGGRMPQGIVFIDTECGCGECDDFEDDETEGTNA